MSRSAFLGIGVACSLAGACGDPGDTDPFNADGSGADDGAADAAQGTGMATGAATGDDGAVDDTAGDGGGDGDGDGDDASDDGVKLDVGAPSGGFGSCGCELTYLWVADYHESTVSKIDTRTLVEEARYLTRPDAAGNPSRTSVNLAGDVAVANRHGGLVKFWGDVADCVESNGTPGIQTSSGPGDVLPWDEEECRAWYTEFPSNNQRPVAWTAGTVGRDECTADEADVWTVASAVPGLFPGMGGAGGVIAYLVDGQTGAIEEQVAVDGFDGGGFGAYGGAVDADDNLWFGPLGTFIPGRLARVDRESLVPTVWDIPQGVSAYGITVDHLGRVWLSSTLGNGAARFDPVDETWDLVPGFFGGSGLAEGPDDWMYVSAGNTVRAVHVETLALGAMWQQSETVKGVSFDADGFLWAVTYHDEKNPRSMAAAFKIDVDTMQTEDVFIGVDDPYTYSDMTGNVLGTVACAPEG